ncbi:tetratricopeptide repeat protein [Pararcticibacter amylolyticus]|uniref:Uncharacterized protein n=1 Tax=Pararcticibacter amylolyticus TaxID=2173175 RepID=A0A2U2PJ32_9SPHI|nr:tetratricopeptide repeat protein [Pararcticibacter amylolyticus]PWG81380.1 hypothetical protein DDR33_05940 [Pararcticibacter amylolyticus]
MSDLQYPLNADVLKGYELIADCYQAKGDPVQAAANYRKAISLNPQNENAAGRLQGIAEKR